FRHSPLRAVRELSSETVGKALRVAQEICTARVLELPQMQEDDLLRNQDRFEVTPQTSPGVVPQPLPKPQLRPLQQLQACRERGPACQTQRRARESRVSGSPESKLRGVQAPSRT